MIALIGLLLGVFLGLVFDVNIPESFSPYMSVAILACLDSVFGAFRASLNNNFKSDIFISGFFGNALLAAGLAYLYLLDNKPQLLFLLLQLGFSPYKNQSA